MLDETTRHEHEKTLAGLRHTPFLMIIHARHTPLSPATRSWTPTLSSFHLSNVDAFVLADAQLQGFMERRRLRLDIRGLGRDDRNKLDDDGLCGRR